MFLTTPNLSIRNLRPADWQDLFIYRSNPDVCWFQGYDPYTEEKCIDLAEKQARAVFGEAGKWVQLGIELIAEGKLIGDIGLKPEADDARIVTFGITLSQHYRGKGYAFEAMQCVIKHLFTRMSINRIYGIADQENTGSIQLMRKLGFVQEGATRESFWNNGMWRDEYLFALLSRDWNQLANTF